MEIDRAKKSAQINTIQPADDKEAALKKAASTPKIKDTFEDASSTKSSGNESSTSQAEPEKKAGQITGGILAKQMTQARLGDPGPKRGGMQNESSGVNELSSEEQKAAAARKQHDTNGSSAESAPGSGGRRPAGEDEKTKSKKELQEFLSKQGFDTASGGGTAVNSSTAGSAGVHGQNPSGMTKDEFDQEMANRKSGPPSASDKFSELNDKLAQQKGHTKTKEDVAKEMYSQIQSGLNQGDPASGYRYGKEMIADGSLGVDVTPQEIEAAKKKANSQTTDDKKAGSDKTDDKKESTWQKVKEIAKEAALGAMEHIAHLPGAGHAAQAPEIVEKVTGHSTDLMDGAKVIGDMQSGNYQGMGSAGQETTQENYEKQKAQKHRKEVKNLLGIDPYAHPSATHYTRNDEVTDGKETVNHIDQSMNVVVQAGGKEKLIGDPGSPDGTENSGGGHFTGGTAVDYENRSGYQGTTRTEDPGDVDTTPGATQLNLASRSTSSDDDDDQDDDQKDTTTKKN